MGTRGHEADMEMLVALGSLVTLGPGIGALVVDDVKGFVEVLLLVELLADSMW